jgi:hypothetical protein
MVSKTSTVFESQLDFCELRKVDNDDDDADDGNVSLIMRKEHLC